MKSNSFGFERARGLVKGCLYGAVAFCVIGLLVKDLILYATLAALVLMVFALFMVFTCLKCPYCGQRIIRNCLTVRSCPHCRRDLVSGIKVKGKKNR